MTDIDLQLPAQRVLVGEIVPVTPMEITEYIIAEWMAETDRLVGQLFRVPPPPPHRIVIPNELDEGAIELFPQPRLGASETP